MTTVQQRLRELRERQSRERQRMVELSREAELTTETRAELDRIESGTPDLERQIRAATTAVEAEDAASTETRTVADGLDAEHRERLDLRRRCNLTTYFRSRLGGMALRGAELEYLAADGVPEGSIPLSVMDPDPRDRAEQRADAPTPTPATTGRSWRRSCRPCSR